MSRRSTAEQAAVAVLTALGLEDDRPPIVELLDGADLLLVIDVLARTVYGLMGRASGEEGRAALLQELALALAQEDES
jgi:hypothetical protein